MLKRPLVCCAALFFSGILLAVYNAPLSVMLFLLVIACLSVIFRMKNSVIFLIALLIMLSGMTRMNLADNYQRRIVSESAGRTDVMTLTVTDFSENNKAIAIFRDQSRNIKVYLSVKAKAELFPGDIVEGEITLRAPFTSKAQLGSFANYLSSERVYLQATAESVRVIDRHTKGIMGKVYSLRTYMDSLGEKYFSGNGRALFNAMVFGDKRLISDELSAALQGSGLNHIAVVSGMHLSLMIALVMFLSERIFGKGHIGCIIGILGAVFITLLTGAGASVVRALAMCTLFQLSRLLYRENDALTSLSFAAWVMALVNPFVIFNAGFVLSVLSVLGIILYNGKMLSFVRRFLPKSAAEAAALSISAQLTVTPALIFYFGIITPYALISNILAVTLSGVYVILGLLFIIASPLGRAATLAAPMLRLLAAAVECVCFEIAALPYSVLVFNGNSMLFAVAWVFLLVLILVYPADIKRICRVTAVFAALTLAVTVTQGSSADIRFIHYGEKTLAAIEPRGGTAFLIDCPDVYDVGTFESENNPFTDVVMTDADAESLPIQKSNIKKVFLPEGIVDDKAKRKLADMAKSADVMLIYKKDAEKFQIDNAVVEYINIDGVDKARGVKVEYGGKTLITLQGLSGIDIERLLNNGTCFRCDFLKLPFAALAENSDAARLCTGKIIAGEGQNVIYSLPK